MKPYYERGDRVRVVGFRGKRAVLRVWEDKGHGLLLCSEATFRQAKNGCEVVAVGFLMSDIVGPAGEANNEEEDLAWVKAQEGK